MRRLSPRARSALAVALVLVAFGLPLRGLLRGPGPPMEEGFMLVFPERVLAGDLPNRDFLHLYGPGGLWLLAGVFKVFGVSLTAQRLVALAEQMALVFGVLLLARWWGWTIAVCCALASVLFIVPPIGLTALAWVGAVGLGLLALVVGLESRRITDPVRAGRRAFGAGALLGIALLFRPDLVIAVTLSALVVLQGAPRTVQRCLVAGLASGVSPYLIHFATAGPANVIQGMVLDPVLYLRGGRQLPIPPPWNRFDGMLQKLSFFGALPWPIPTLSSPAQLALWFHLVLGSVASIVGVAAWAVRRDARGFRPRVLVTVAAFSVGILPQALQRADSTHLAWVACVVMALLPVALLETALTRRVGPLPRRTSLLAGGAVLAAIALLIPDFTLRKYTDYVLQSIGIHRHAYAIEHRGRTFLYGDEADAIAARRVLEAVEHVARPGDRLFVGPSDLRRTPYGDAFFYFLLPQLTPATYYIELDPGVANAPGSRLAEDLRSADLVILSSAWDSWDEPNGSRKLGSDEPNRVVRELFCRVGTFDPHYELYVRCERLRGPHGAGAGSGA